ncbi:Aspartate--tRNA ligase 2, cytoplasmic [Arachis hypogaea]|nr:Aspartate--tRNA ligase 2, cytoplasmic [Arachis hypogaea]
MIESNSILQGELFAIWRGYLLAWDVGQRDVICETDCVEAFNLVTQDGFGFIDPLVLKIRDIMHWNWRVDFRLIMRDANTVADTMAKMAIKLQLSHVELLSPWEDHKKKLSSTSAPSPSPLLSSLFSLLSSSGRQRRGAPSPISSSTSVVTMEPQTQNEVLYYKLVGVAKIHANLDYRDTSSWEEDGVLCCEKATRHRAVCGASAGKFGLVSVPSKPIKGTTKQDAARSEAEIEKALQAGEPFARVNLDTRLNFRVIEFRTATNQAIFSVQAQVGEAFRKFLSSEGFVEIHTPRIIAGSSEGGAAVFKLDYKGRPACLAQSTALHKHMTISSNFDHSFIPRHLCEYVALDVEMEIKWHYVEVMDIVDRLFVSIFDSLNQNCKKGLEAYLRQTPRLTYEEGVQMLRCSRWFSVFFATVESLTSTLRILFIFTNKNIRKCCKVIFTMSCSNNSQYSNSFDVFMKEMLKKQAESCGIDVKTISTHIDSVRYPSWPLAQILCVTLAATVSIHQ